MTTIPQLAAQLGRDVFLYNGPMRRFADMECIQGIAQGKQSAHATLILVTPGGDPDAAFKIARYFQARYDSFTVLVSGLCKSAGTLLAIGAHELVFMPYGELGPLDIQMNKVDRFEGMQSGLIIQDSLVTLEERAQAMYYNNLRSLMINNQGMLSFATASVASVELVKAIYGPIMSRIDPEEIGVRARAMRIAQDYGMRLDAEGRNLKPNTLTLLSEKYPSHSFVIDHIEAVTMFNRVRLANDIEKAIVDQLGQLARYPSGETTFNALHEVIRQGDTEDDQTDGAGNAASDGGDSSAADAAPISAAGTDDQPVGSETAAH